MNLADDIGLIVVRAQLEFLITQCRDCYGTGSCRSNFLDGPPYFECQDCKPLRELRDKYFKEAA